MTNAERFKPYFTPTESLLLTLEWHEGMTVSEIASTLGLSHNETLFIRTSAHEKARRIKDLQDARKSERSSEDDSRLEEPEAELNFPESKVYVPYKRAATPAALCDKVLTYVEANGSVSTHQTAVALKLTTDQTRAVLNALIQAGKVDRIKAYRLDCNGRKRYGDVFLPKKEPSN